MRDPMNAADENQAREDRDHDADHQRVQTESVVDGASDRIGLHHDADKAERDNNRNGEETGEKFRPAFTDDRR